MTIEEYNENKEVRDNDLRILLRDSRINALHALISDIKDETMVWVSNPGLAAQPGKQNHSLGSISGLLTIQHHLLSIATKDENEDEG
jgi:hypothetical protein